MSPARREPPLQQCNCSWRPYSLCQCLDCVCVLAHMWHLMCALKCRQQTTVLFIFKLLALFRRAAPGPATDDVCGGSQSGAGTDRGAAQGDFGAPCCVRRSPRNWRLHPAHLRPLASEPAAAVKAGARADRGAAQGDPATPDFVSRICRTWRLCPKDARIQHQCQGLLPMNDLLSR